MNKINDLKVKDRCREKELDFFIALRREIEDKYFLTLCRRIPQGEPIPPGKHLSAQSRPIDKKKNAEKQPLKSEINVGYPNKAGKPSAFLKEEANQSEWRQEGEAKERFSSLQAASNNGFSAASHCCMNNGCAGLDEQPSVEKNSEKLCHLERNWLLTYF
ncbi:hypothetical protein ACOSQ2_017667 [Xanthoceras sorbifolium]